MSRWKKVARWLKVELVLPQKTDIQGKGRIQLCHLTLPSASGPDALRLLPVEYGLSARKCAHTYFTFCCTSYVSQGCDSAVHGLIPDNGGVQYYCIQHQQLQFITHFCAGPLRKKHEGCVCIDEISGSFLEQSEEPFEICRVHHLQSLSCALYLVCLFKWNRQSITKIK